MDSLDFLLNKIVIFDQGTGCIEPRSRAYCYRIDYPYVWVHFERPILGRNDIKLHFEVIEKHGTVMFEKLD